MIAPRQGRFAPWGPRSPSPRSRGEGRGEGKLQTAAPGPAPHPSPLPVRGRGEGIAPRPVRLATAAALSLFGLAHHAHAFDHAQVARRALENHIRPGYTRFASAAAALEGDTRALCEMPSPAGLARLRGAFREALLAWGRVEHLRFGPISEDKRYERILFWPDQRGLGRRQVERLLADEASKGLTAAELAGKSVAIQGFSALDIVAFAPGSEAMTRPDGAAPARCAYARSIAGNIAVMAKAVETAWADPSGYSASWLDPRAGNPHFLTPKETTRALVTAYLAGLEQTRDLRLAGPLGFRDPRRRIRPLTPPMPNSGLAVLLIAANIEGVRALLSESGFLEKGIVGSPAGEGESTTSVLAAIAAELDNAAASAKAAADLSAEPFKNTEARQKLVPIGFPLKNARVTGGTYLSRAAGLGVGFNAGDGD